MRNAFEIYGKIYLLGRNFSIQILAGNFLIKFKRLQNLSRKASNQI
jgi:hypothetical protein